MLTAWTVILVALAYVGVLFAIASYGDRAARRTSRGRPLIYALSLAVYCTSWAYFGSVGIAATSGYDFLPIYIGPIMMLTSAGRCCGHRRHLQAPEHHLDRRLHLGALRQEPGAGALVAVIAVIGVLPYISLQLKAVSFSLTTPDSTRGTARCRGDLALVVAIAMAVFAALFGTRHVDATEHQRGLILAIAVQSVVKLSPSWPSASSPPSG
jgi:Na+/proline symporter